jgi:hypothetical protein
MLSVINLTIFLSAITRTTLTAVVNITAGPDPFRWAAIGDSWSSGVAWSKASSYDNNKDKCLRLKDSYAVQMFNDRTWVQPGVGEITFEFKGCSGGRLEDMYDGQQQIKQTDQPRVVVLTVGGNNALFAPIVDSCVYLSNPLFDYGKRFDLDTASTGECKRNLNSAQNYITSDTEFGMAAQLRTTLDKLFGWAANEKKLPYFYLYVTGYAHFWNDLNDECNNWSFSLWARPDDRMPYLTRAFRQRFNDVTENFLQVYVRILRRCRRLLQNIF